MPLAVRALAVVAALAQVPFEAAVADLKSPDRETRLRAVRLLKEAGRPESVRPLVPLIRDADDEIQFEAIGAELNAFLAEKIISKRRVRPKPRVSALSSTRITGTRSRRSWLACARPI